MLDRDVIDLDHTTQSNWQVRARLGGSRVKERVHDRTINIQDLPLLSGATPVKRETASVGKAGSGVLGSALFMLCLGVVTSFPQAVGCDHFLP